MVGGGSAPGPVYFDAAGAEVGSVREVGTPYWPLADLRLRTGDLRLRPIIEADLAAIADLLPDDVELDPAAPILAGLDRRLQRGVVLHQAYWNARGTWRLEHWRLNFAVFAGAELIGTQELEGEDFAVLRTVDTSSFLAVAARGHGIGKRMRRAVLALAFGPLGAQVAVTSAWHDNSASLGVSRALGYQPNGRSWHRRGTGVDEFTHLRLTRDRWLSAPTGPATTITGFEPCRPWFALAGDAAQATPEGTGPSQRSASASPDSG